MTGRELQAHIAVERRAAREHLDALLDSMLPSRGHCGLPEDRQCGAYEVPSCACKQTLDRQEAS